MGATLHRIRAVNYRCLRNVDVELNEFNVLVGANGSGKSALFDALLFVGDMVRTGLDSAIDRRVNDLRDLVWGRPEREPRFALELELDLPENTEGIPESHERMAVFVDVKEAKDGLTGTLEATVTRKSGAKFPRWTTRMRFDADSAFEPEVEFGSPIVAGHVERTVSRIGEITLDNRVLRRASAPLRRWAPTPDRALPWLILRLRRYPKRFADWKKHICTAISDFQDIRVKRRSDDRHAYLVVAFGSGVEVPSWALSDGTLRLLALSIIAYLPEEGRTHLIEEPENGVHPLAVESIYRSLSSSYGAQVLVTTHSPVLLACIEPRELLCFSKHDGETQIVRGDEHPHLRHWQSAADVDLLFAPEVLG